VALTFRLIVQEAGLIVQPAIAEAAEIAEAVEAAAAEIVALKEHLAVQKVGLSARLARTEAAAEAEGKMWEQQQHRRWNERSGCGQSQKVRWRGPGREKSRVQPVRRRWRGCVWSPSERDRGRMKARR
jgi:hypothetical protein